MKRSNLMLLAIGVTIIMMGCSKEDHLVIEPDQNDPLTASLKSGKPAPNLVGTMELDFDLTAIWPEDPVWVGTVSFEGYGTYGIRFFHLSPFKEYSQASPFEEYFEILDESGSVVLGGPDEGVTVLANKPPEPTKYVMNGEIDTAIDGPPCTHEWRDNLAGFRIT
jgi:hypothetical protein